MHALARDLTADSATANVLARALGLRPLTAQLLARRGVATVERARRFLAPRLADLRPPESMDGIAPARARDMDVVVVDHHQVPERDPGAHAMINPHQPTCGFPFKGLASAGVGFYLAAALRTRLRLRGRDAPDPRALLDLVALG